MEILQNGRTSNVITCPDCSCTFRYCKIDEHYSDGRYEVRCPECDKTIITRKSLYR